MGYVHDIRRIMLHVAYPVTRFPTAFGLLKEYHSNHSESLKGNTANVTVIGTTITVCLLFSSSYRDLKALISRATAGDCMANEIVFSRLS